MFQKLYKYKYYLRAPINLMVLLETLPNFAEEMSFTGGETEAGLPTDLTYPWSISLWYQEF